MSANPPGCEPGPPEQRRLVRRVVVAVVAALVVGAFISLIAVGLTANGVDTSIDSAIARGELKQAPEFALPVLAHGAPVGKRDGEVLSLSDLRGHPVVINFWASWCDPCKREASILEDTWRYARDRGVVVLGIDVQDLSGSALDFIGKYGQTYPHVRDKSDETYRAYGLTGVPETFFLDRAGRVRVRWIGEINAEQMAAGLDVILPRKTR